MKYITALLTKPEKKTKKNFAILKGLVSRVCLYISGVNLKIL
jgi:hypothetical protein